MSSLPGAAVDDVSFNQKQVWLYYFVLICLLSAWMYEKHHVYAKMCQFTSFWEHGIGYFTKRIESFNDCIEHDNKMLVSIKVLYIAFSLVKTEDIHPPKTGISVHFCVLSLMAMQK